MSFSFISKCLIGVSTVGAASFFPVFYSAKGPSNQQVTSTVEQGSQASARTVGYASSVATTQARKETDQKHDDCLDRNLKMRIKNPQNPREEREVTLSEYTSQYSGWDPIGSNYESQCSRKLEGMQ